MKVLAITLAMMASLPMMAQTNNGDITVDAQLRSRGEYRNGQGSLREKGAEPATFINERARLGIGWELDNLSMKFSAQHTGVYGDTPQTNKNGDVSFNEAWAKLKFGTDGRFFGQLGRQILSYDDERILGGLDWATAGRSHDALRLGYADGTSTLHAILAYNQKAENSFDNDYTGNVAGYKTMQSLWYHYNTHAAFQGSLLFMNVGMEGANETTHVTRCMQTFGTHLTFRTGALNASLSGYYQTGHNKDNQKVSAYMVGANVKYQVAPQLSIGLADDLLSGNSNDTKADECNVFDVLYGTHHKFYGTMDYFNGSALRKRGLNDLNVTAAYMASDKVDMSATYHYFAAPFLKVSDVDNGTNFNTKSLGSELDLQLNWRVQKNVTLQAGYSFMAATKSLQLLQGSGNHYSWQDWGWVSLNINPRIFSSKK